jgi:hypothetical protein
MMKMQADHQKYDCYVGMLPGTVLARLYDELGQRLIERNVRSFLQAKNAVNKGIRDTVRDEPEMFMAYNNGISTVAEWIESDDLGNGIVSVHSLHGWQIVNGGQTTASLANAYKAKLDLSQVFVPIKLTILKSGKTRIGLLLIYPSMRTAKTKLQCRISAPILPGMLKWKKFREEYGFRPGSACAGSMSAPAGNISLSSTGKALQLAKGISGKRTPRTALLQKHLQPSA